MRLRVDIQNKTYFKKALNTILPDLKLSEFSGITIDSRNIKPGDIFLAFSTSNMHAFSRKNISDIQMISNDMIDPFLQAVVESTEESIINSLFAAETMTGINNNKVYELPINRLKELLN